MKQKTINTLAAVILLTLPAMAAPPLSAAKRKTATIQKQASAAPCPPAGSVISPTERLIETGPIEVSVPISGVPTAHETYDVFALFDGRVEEIRVELFNLVTPQTILGRMVSTEMAALLDATPESGRAQAERRWQDVYKFYNINPEATGVITNIYMNPKTQVYKGDRLFTVAKKVMLICKNKEPLYSGLSAGMPADMKHYRTGELFKTRLVNSLRLKDNPYYSRIWLEVLDLKSGIRIGEQFDGTLFVGNNPNARIVPRKSLLQRGDKKFLLMEVETGLVTEADAEIVRPGSTYLDITNPDKETADGTQKE